jgi:hypothetical protein
VWPFPVLLLTADKLEAALSSSHGSCCVPSVPSVPFAAAVAGQSQLAEVLGYSSGGAERICPVSTMQLAAPLETAWLTAPTGPLFMSLTPLSYVMAKCSRQVPVVCAAADARFVNPVDFLCKRTTHPWPGRAGEQAKHSLWLLRRPGPRVNESIPNPHGRLTHDALLHAAGPVGRRGHFPSHRTVYSFATP